VHYDRKAALLCRTKNDIPVVRCAGGTHAKRLSLYLLRFIDDSDGQLTRCCHPHAELLSRLAAGSISIFSSRLFQDICLINSQRSSIVHCHAELTFDIHDVEHGQL
jgi:hypothetical protein